MEYEKSRVVGANLRDKGSKKISTKAPTITRMGQRIGLSTACQNDYEFLRDVVQSYIQSFTKMRRKVYYYPLVEMKIPENSILLAVKPLYGIPEAGLHWFMTYSNHHIKELAMQTCSTDKCMLFRNRDKQKNVDLVILQVDDTFGTGSKTFLDEEEKSNRFLCKPRKPFEIGTSLKFNGSTIERIDSDTYKLSQMDRLSKFKVPGTVDES